MLKHTSNTVTDVKLRIQSRNSKTTIYGILLAQVRQTTATVPWFILKKGIFYCNYEMIPSQSGAAVRKLCSRRSMHILKILPTIIA